MIWDKLLSGRITRAYRELRLQLQTFGLWQVLLYTGQAFFPTTHYLLRYLRGDEKIYIGNLRNGPSFPEERHASPVMKDRLNSALRWQHKTTLVDLLHYGDALSMAHSVESRLPFMDHRLVELCFRLPGHLKFVEARGKAILRRAVRSDVPREILDNRHKLGFVTPFAEWFRRSPEATVYPVLKSEACRTRGIFDPSRIDHALKMHESGKVDLSNHIFRWITTELWFQQFIDTSSYSGNC